MNYYNEFDPYAAAWLRNLIAEKLIPYGVVDERSIEDVAPSDLAGFTQCHFFAGIAGWPLALSLAGFPDDYPIWTGSCPCQPFSAAGEGKGFDDERHLWPAFHWLIQQCRPARVVGEQVASKVADPWIDLVSADLEALDFAFGAVAFPSASVGAPHIRDRTYWVAHANSFGREQVGRNTEGYRASGGNWQGDRACNGSTDDQQPRVVTGKINMAPPIRLEYPKGIGRIERWPESSGRGIDTGRPSIRLADPHVEAPGARGRPYGESAARDESGFGASGCSPTVQRRPGPTNGYWSAVDWLACRDGKWRCVEPGTFPLADGVSDRVGRLRAYGNAINPWQAAQFLEAALR